MGRAKDTGALLSETSRLTSTGRGGASQESPPAITERMKMGDETRPARLVLERVAETSAGGRRANCAACRRP